MVKPKSTLKCFILIALEPLEPTKPERCVAGHYSGDSNYSASSSSTSLTVNAAAEKIIRQELQRQGAPARFMVVPGEGAAQSSAVRPTRLDEAR